MRVFSFLKKVFKLCYNFLEIICFSPAYKLKVNWTDLTVASGPLARMLTTGILFLSLWAVSSAQGKSFARMISSSVL